MLLGLQGLSLVRYGGAVTEDPPFLEVVSTTLFSNPTTEILFTGLEQGSTYELRGTYTSDAVGINTEPIGLTALLSGVSTGAYHYNASFNQAANAALYGQWTKQNIPALLGPSIDESVLTVKSIRVIFTPHANGIFVSHIGTGGGVSGRFAIGADMAVGSCDGIRLSSFEDTSETGVFQTGSFTLYKVSGNA